MAGRILHGSSELDAQGAELQRSFSPFICHLPMFISSCYLSFLLVYLSICLPFWLCVCDSDITGSFTPNYKPQNPCLCLTAQAGAMETNWRPTRRAEPVMEEPGPWQLGAMSVQLSFIGFKVTVWGVGLMGFTVAC